MAFVTFRRPSLYWGKQVSVWAKWRAYKGAKCCIFDNKQQKWCNCVVISGSIFSHKQWILRSGHVNSFLSIPLDFGQFTTDSSENKYSDKPKKILYFFSFYILHYFGVLLKAGPRLSDPRPTAHNGPAAWRPVGLVAQSWFSTVFGPLGHCRLWAVGLLLAKPIILAYSFVIFLRELVILLMHSGRFFLYMAMVPKK